MFIDAAVVLESPVHAWRERLAAMKPWMKQAFVGLIGVVVVAILGVVINISYNLGQLDARTTSNSERITNIANVLRGLGIKLAWEAINTPFPTVVLVGQPVRRVGKWKVGMSVLDTQKGKLTAYEANLHSRDDLALILSFAWGIKALDKTALTIEEMEAFAKEIQSPLIGPTDINKKVSYVVYKNPGAVNLHLMNLGYTKTGSHNAPKVYMWSDLVEAMNAKKLRLKLFMGKPRKGKAPPPPAP